MPVSKGTLLNHTRELVDDILTDWRGGASYVETAARLNLNKSTVAGIVYRNKEPGEESARSFFEEPSTARTKPALPPMRRAPEGDRRPKWMMSRRMVPGARFRDCQYIKGQKGVDFNLYAAAPKCPAETKPGSPYCPAHHLRCHVKTRSEEAA